MPTQPSPSRAARATLLGLLCSLGLAGCSTEQVEDKARELGDKAEQAAKDKTRELADQAGDRAKRWWDDEVPSTGELSDKGKQLLAAGAEQGPQSVEQLLTRGEQLAPTALAIGKTLRDAIESDTIVEPIVQKVDDAEGQAELDRKIADMPRVETIDDVSVGFKDMTLYDSGGRTTESAYLVLWRRDDRLLGFIYRSKKRIHVDTLVRETPRLVALVQGAL